MRTKAILKILNKDCEIMDCIDCEFREKTEEGLSDRSCKEWQKLSKNHCADVYNPNIGFDYGYGDKATKEVNARVDQQILNTYMGRGY